MYISSLLSFSLNAVIDIGWENIIIIIIDDYVIVMLEKCFYNAVFSDKD